MLAALLPWDSMKTIRQMELDCSFDPIYGLSPRGRHAAHLATVRKNRLRKAKITTSLVYGARLTSSLSGSIHLYEADTSPLEVDTL